MAGYKTTPKENWAPREKPKESYKEIIKESKQEWRDTGGKSYSRQQYEAGKQQTAQKPKNGYTTQTLDDYLKSGSTDSTTTQSYLDQVNATLNDPDTSEADYLNNKNYQTALEAQLKADRKREKKADRLAAISGEINDIKNLITGGYNDVQPEEKRWEPPPGYVAGGTDTDEGKLAQARVDLNQMEWVYNGSDISEEDKADLEDKIAAKKAEIKALEGGGWEDDRHRGQQESIPDLLLNRNTSGEERAEAQAPTGTRPAAPSETEKTPEEMGREELVDAYQKANDFVEQNAGYVTDPMAEAFFNPAQEQKEALEQEIKKQNKEEGLGVYTDLAGNAAASDAAESFIGERQAGMLSSLGAALGGIDANVGYASEDEKTLNLQWIQAHAKAMASGDPADWAEADRLEGELEALQEQNKGKRHGLLGKLADLFLGSSEDLRETANEQWSDFTADMGGGEKFAWEIAKGAGNLAFDMVDNVIVPGAGTMRMFLGAAGGEVQDLMDSGEEDPDKLFLTAVKGGANAWLSNKLLGGVEAAYGKSVLGGLTEKAFAKASPAVQRAAKVLLNTEGAEEGLEDVLNWAGDIILGLDEESRLSFDEVKQDALVGYILGVLTNGLAGGIEYDAAKRQALAQEAVDFAMSGMTLEEAVQKAKSDTMDQVVMKANPQENQKADENGRYRPDQDTNVNENVDTNVQTEQPAQQAEVRAEQNAPEVTGRMPTKWHDLQNIVEQSDNAAIQASGTGQYMVYKRGDTGAFRVFNDVEDARAYYNEVNEQTAPAETAAEPEIPLRDRMENDQVTEDEYLNLLQSDDGRQQLADALGIEQTDYNSVAAGVGLYLMGKEQAASQAEVRAEQQAPTAEQMLLGEKTAPEAQTEPVENPAPEQVNTPSETENANTEGLTEPETKGEQNVPLQEQKPDQKRTKISQYFTNTLTESGRAAGLDPVEYNPTSEAESLTNAAMRLSEDKQAVLDTLMKSPAWDNEMVDSAWLLENEFYKEFVRTGDRTNWDAWRKLETYKISQTAKGLQAVAKQSRPGAAGVLEASLKLLEDFRKGGEKAGQVNDAAIAKAEKNVSEVTQKMAKLENDIDDQIANGMSEEEAKATAKSAYLDLAEEINRIRGTGKMFTGDSRFRAMLANQDMDFIQRFVACQAAGIAEDVQYKGKQDAGKKLNTLQKLSQLTGTGTWLRNLSGNASFGLIDLLSNNSPVTLISDAIVGKATGRRSTGFEFGAADKGTLTAAKRALERSILEVAANIDLAEESGNTKYDMARTRTFDPKGKTLSRVLSRWEQWNGYMLTSSDRAFRGGTENSVRNAIIRANGWDANNLTPQQQAQINETARQVADYRLFQNQGTAAKAANDLRSTFNRVGFGGKGDTHEGGFGAGTAIMPYTTVPTNIGVKALEFSPAGAVKGLAEMIKVGMDGKNATMAQQNQAVTDFSRGITGTALIVGLAQLMKNAPFFKDWENEDDKDVKAQNKAEGKSGMQFNIDMMLRAADGDNDPTWRNDDRTIDISSLEPVNQLITAASLMAEGEDFGSAVISSAKENFMELPSVSALKNIEDTIRYTNTPDDIKQTALNTAASTAGSVASGFIPAPLRHIATVTDEYARDTSGNNAAERSVNQIKSAIPGLRQTLPVKTDNFGNEVTAGDFSTRFANTYDAFKHGQVNQSEVSREIEQIRNETGVSLMPDRNGPSSVNINGEKIKLSAEDRKAWKDTIGQQDEADMLLLMRNPVYQNADWEMKAELGKNLEEYATDRTKEFYARRNGLDYESRYDYLEDVDNPITWLTTNKAFNLAQSDGKWDVVDQLIGPIRNMTDAERELMRKKNSTAMSYYDYLTPNARGYSVKDAETVHALKEGEKARATARGVQSASGQDTFGELYDGYRNRTYNDQDVDAFMTKQAADGDWDVTKGRAAIYLAVRAGHGSVAEALEAVKNADIDRDGTIDEKGVKIKAEKEGTITLDGVNVPDRGAMWNAFNEIMYPWKVG